MVETIDNIKAPIEHELQEFEKHFRQSVKSNTALLDKIMYYIVKRKGKQIRPMLVFLCAKICGEVNQSSYVAASLVELLHTATLVHDDVVDDAQKRRGVFSINALWKNKVAVLVGDYLLSRGLLLALNNNQHEQLRILSQAVKDMSEGELLQIEKARKLDIEESIYYEIIRQKTASLIAAACSSGAASTTENVDDVAKFHKFGEKIGMAFQIKDDLFDYGEADIGKPRGIDIKEKKMTLPLIYALQNTSKTTKRHIIHSIKNKSEDPSVVKEVIQFVKDSGGIEYSRRVMMDFKEQALEILVEFPYSESREALGNLVHYVTERKK